MKNLFAKNLNFLIKKNNINIGDFCSQTGCKTQRILKIINGQTLANVQEILETSHFFYLPTDLLLLEDIEKKENLISTFDFRFLALDIDGVMTDGGMFYAESGDEFKKFNAKDGLAIIRLIEGGYHVGFISSGFNKEIIQRRAQLLKVQHVYCGTWKKTQVIENWCKNLNISMKNVAYIGDDLNDIDLMRKVGFTACPADAAPEVKHLAHVVLSKGGGKGCIREFVDNYLSAYTKNPF